MGNFFVSNMQGLLTFADSQTSYIVSSSGLPLLIALVFLALGEWSLWTVIMITSLKLSMEYHELTATHPTAMSRVFRGIIVCMIVHSAWTYPFQQYLSLFLLLLSVVFGAWILALSNLYPFTEQSQNKSSSAPRFQPQIKHDLDGSGPIGSTPSTFGAGCSFSNLGNLTNISSADSSFHSTFSGGARGSSRGTAGGSAGGSSAINDSFHYSPNKERMGTAAGGCTSTSTSAQPLQSNSNILNTANVPFEMDHNQTLICDDLPTENTLNMTRSALGAPYDFNKLSSSSMATSVPDAETLKMAQWVEPANFFQAVVGFSSVHCVLNALCIFDDDKKRGIMASMDRGTFFHLSCLHLQAMMVDVFSFILIPFFLCHILLFYHSQHSTIPIGYVLTTLFVNQYGENVVNSLFAGHPGVARRNVLSQSITDKLSLEGTITSVLLSSATALALYCVMGLCVFGTMCGAMRAALKLNPSLREKCIGSQCLFCEGSFVGMGWMEHLVMGTLLALQAVLGRLMVETVIKSYSFKMGERRNGGVAGNGDDVLWMRKCSPFIFAFAVSFYYLM